MSTYTVNNADELQMQNHIAIKNRDKSGGLLPPCSPKTSYIHDQIEHVLKPVIK